MQRGFAIELLNLRLGFWGSGLGADLMDRYVFPGVPREPLRASDFTFRLEHGEGGFRVYRDGAEYASPGGPEHAPDSATGDHAMVGLQQAVDEHVVQNARDFAFVHCGAVGADGAAVLLVATSGLGKSTLVEALAPWADYYSDEYAAIDGEGRLHPYPRSLLLRSGRPVQRPVTVQALGGRVAPGPAEVRLVLEIPYAPEAGLEGLRVEPLEQSYGLRLLLQSTPQALEDCPGIFGSLGLVAGRARTFRGTRGDAGGAAQHVLGMLSSAGDGR